MKTHARAVAAALAATTAVIVAGCGSTGPGMPASSGTTTAGAATSHSTAPVTTTSAASPARPGAAPATSPGRCHTSMLSARVTMGNPGAGQRYASLVLTNTSGTTCLVYGYPGMRLITGPGGSVPTDVVRTSPHPRLVTVKPGTHVYSLLHWTVVPAADETSSPCEPQASRTLVTPPDETAILTTSWPGGSVCQHGQVFVTPFSAGTGP